MFAKKTTDNTPAVKRSSGLTSEQYDICRTNDLRRVRTSSRAAETVRNGEAYASVGRAPAGFIKQHSHWPLELFQVPAEEKPPTFGSFAFSLADTQFRKDLDRVRSGFLGTEAHREMVARFGFTDDEVDLVMQA